MQDRRVLNVVCWLQVCRCTTAASGEALSYRCSLLNAALSTGESRDSVDVRLEMELLLIMTCPQTVNLASVLCREFVRVTMNLVQTPVGGFLVSRAVELDKKR